jgi:hypothetical protein
MSHRLAWLLTTFVVLASIVVSGPVRGASIITNGDFEAGNVGFSTDYASSPTVHVEGQYAIVNNPAQTHPFAGNYGDHTTGSGLLMVVNGSPDLGAIVWSTTVSVNPQTDYLFSSWVSSWIVDSPAHLDFLFNGTSIGTFTAPSDQSVWDQFAGSWNSGASTSLTIEIIDRNELATGNDFALDDISLQGSAAVPEPSSLALTLIGSCAAGGWFTLRRRKAVRG